MRSGDGKKPSALLAEEYRWRRIDSSSSRRSRDEDVGGDAEAPD
jgi:hypothetical protein